MRCVATSPRSSRRGRSASPCRSTRARRCSTPSTAACIRSLRGSRVAMLTEATIAALAAELHDAQRRRGQLRHFSMRHPGMTIDDGYAIQRAWLALRLAEGRVVKGRKIGLTSRAMQQASQINEPDFAPLLDDMFFASGGDIPIDRFIAPRVEVELAFILGKVLKGPGVTIADALAATELVTPAVEIIDARIE